MSIELFKMMVVRPFANAPQSSGTLAEPITLMMPDRWQDPEINGGNGFSPIYKFKALESLTGDLFVAADTDSSLIKTIEAYSLKVEQAHEESPTGSVDSIQADLVGLVNNPDWSTTKHAVNESLVAIMLTLPSNDENSKRLKKLTRTINLVEKIAGGRDLTLNEAINLLASPVFLPKQIQRKRSEALTDGTLASLDSRIRQLAVLKKAVSTRSMLNARHELIRNALQDLCSIDPSELELVETYKECPDDRGVMNYVRWARSICQNLNDPGIEAGISQPGRYCQLNAKKAERFATEHAEIIDDLRINIHSIEFRRLINTLTEALQVIRGNSSALNASNLVGSESTEEQSENEVMQIVPIELTGGGFDWLNALDFWDVLSGAGGFDWSSALDFWDDLSGGDIGFMLPGLFSFPSQIQSRGIGELYIIRSQITHYSGGELSHIENILQGETRDRSHRRSVKTEDIRISERDTETEEERSLQTTERTDLEREVERTISEEFDASAGAQVSASYGPTISVELTGEISTSESEEEASRMAQKIATEVTEKAASKVRERILERHETRRLLEIEETNRHAFGLDGGSSSNITGYYQWLDKVYQNEIWSAGARTMYDVLIPEPGDHWRSVYSQKLDDSSLMNTPIEDLSQAPEELNEEELSKIIKKYELADNFYAMPKSKIISEAFQGTVDSSPQDNTSSIAKTIQIPDGYRPVSAIVIISQFKAFPADTDRDARRGPSPNSRVTVGDKSVSLSDWNVRTRVDSDSAPESIFKVDLYGGEDPQLFSLAEGGSLPISVSVNNFTSFAVTVQVLAEPSPSSLHEWQWKTYSQLQSAIAEKRRAQQDNGFARELEKQLGGNEQASLNPAISKSVVHAELRRAMIEVFRNRTFDFDMMLSDEDTSSHYLTTHFARRNEQAPEIRFLEQAFEWENLTYILYPYFYGRTETWDKKLRIETTDTKFREFLNAGSARVNVPVRPGFVLMVEHFMATGQPWGDDTEDAVADEVGLTVHDQLLAREGRLNGPPVLLEEKTFITRVSTNLVRLVDSPPKWEKVDNEWPGTWQGSTD